MNKINIKKIITVSTLALSFLLTAGATQADTFTLLTGQLDYGQTSTNVTNLQIFLASDPSIYPQGKVTGYFGPLTKSAVMNFQSVYGISQVGRVGPATLEKINSLISSGVGLSGGSTSNANAAVIYSPSVNASSGTGAIVSWTTSKSTTGKVYYSPAPFQLAEATTNSSKPTITGGASTPETTSYQTNQNISIQNLQPNTPYYYMIEATDSSGNLTYTWPTTFTTSH